MNHQRNNQGDTPMEDPSINQQTGNSTATTNEQEGEGEGNLDDTNQSLRWDNSVDVEEYEKALNKARKRKKYFKPKAEEISERISDFVELQPAPEESPWQHKVLNKPLQEMSILYVSSSNHIRTKKLTIEKLNKDFDFIP